MVIDVRDRVVTMRVTLSTPNRKTQQRGADNLDGLGNALVASDVWIDRPVASAVRLPAAS